MLHCVYTTKSDLRGYTYKNEEYFNLLGEALDYIKYLKEQVRLYPYNYPWGIYVTLYSNGKPWKKIKLG